jgi:hypothetical protein
MFKKIGVILLLIMAIGGFSMSAVSAVCNNTTSTNPSSVSAIIFNGSHNLTIGEHFNVTVYCGYDDEPIGDALDYIDVITHHPQKLGSHILEFVAKKVTPEGKPAQFKIHHPWYDHDPIILNFNVKE